MNYPRPQLKRNSFISLDGTWQLNHHDINVPFPPQAPLATYPYNIDKLLCYQKNFTLPDDFYQPDQKILLHFGAVDQIAKIYLNDQYLTQHTGGYLPFTVDLSKAIKPGKNDLVVEVIDELSHDYPYGKQSKVTFNLNLLSSNNQ